jgi:hypothetical protein
VQLPAVDHERPRQPLEDPLGHCGNLLVVAGVLDEHGELVPAEAGHGVAGPHAGVEPLGHLDQEPVAGGVAQAVVDLLEAVQVQEQHGHRGCFPPAPFEGVVDPVLEQGPVGQRGQVVVEGLVGQLVLELAALGDVAGVEDQPAHAGVVEQVGDGELHRALLPVAVLEWELQLDHAVGYLGDLGQALPQPGPGTGMEDVAERSALKVGLAVAEDPGHGLADVLDLAVGPDQDDDLGAVLDQRLEALLAGPQLGRALDHPRFQVAGQPGVLQQGEDLPADQGDDDEGPGPGGEGVEDALLDLGHGADRQGPDDGDVGQEHAHAVHAGVGLLLLVDRVRVRLAGGQQDEQVAEEPAGVDQPPGGIGLAGRQVHEPAVGHGQGDQPGPDQRQGRHPGPLAHPRLGQDEQDDGADDHVADRVGEADRLGQAVVAPGPEQRPQHQHPAGQQHRGRDHQAVQDLAEPPDQALGGEGEADEGGRGQRGRGQVADVGQ